MLSVGSRDEEKKRLGLGFGGGGGWEGMEESELEEGEACYGQEDNSCINPDIALSYIDEKLQNVLGHFQKDFEGVVSAENLGAKFGVYGSFLPTYQRSPSVLPQTRSPPKALNHNAVRSPYNPALDGPRQNPSVATCSSVSRNNIVPAAPSLDNSGKKDLHMSTPSNGQFISQHEPFNKPVNGNDQKTLKVRIKVGPDNNLAKNNAAIYSGLGLDVSPSSSLEDSPYGSGGLSPELGDITDESPRTILQVMASFLLPGDFVLSPLQGSLLELAEKSNTVSKCKTGVLYEGIPETQVVVGNLTQPMSEVRGQKEKKMKSDQRFGKSVEVDSSKCKDDISSILNKDIDIETPAGQELVSNALNIPLLTGSINSGRKVERQVAEESAKGNIRILDHSKEPKKISVKERKLSPDLLKDDQLGSMESLEHNRVDVLEDEARHSKGKLNSRTSIPEKALEEQCTGNHKDASSDMRREGKIKVERSYDMDRADFDGYKERRDPGPADHVRQISSQKATLHEYEGEKTLQGKGQVPEGQRKPKGSQTDARPLSKENLLKEKKKSSQSRAEYSGKKSKRLKFQKESSRDSFRETHGDVIGDVIAEKVESGAASLDLHYKDKLKIVKPNHGKEPVSLSKTSKERSGNKKVDHPPVSGAFVNEPITVPLTCNAPTTDVIAAPLAPVVIKENWVMCDVCQKWRLLPYGTDPDQLPKNWQCNMLNWLSGMNRCDVSEEETTKALNALYIAPAPEIGAHLDGHHNAPASNITSTSVLHRDQKLENNLQSVPSIRKRKIGPKDAPTIPIHPTAIPLSKPVKKNLQASIKSRSLDDMNHNTFETNSLGKIGSGQTSKSTDFAIEKLKPKQKEKHKNLGCYSDGGDFMEKSERHSKMKGKKEVDEDDSRVLKRTKKGGTHYPIKDWQSDQDAAVKAMPNTSCGLSTKGNAKYQQNCSDFSSSKEFISDPRGSSSTSFKRSKDEFQVYSNDEIKEHTNASDAERFDKEGSVAKKRKMKDAQESQHNSDAHMGRQLLINNGLIAKEVLSENELVREKKTKVLKSVGKGLSISKPDGCMDKKGHENGILFPANAEHLSDDSLKRDLAYAQASTAATSSSSKVSGSHKSKANVQEPRGSPVESVSSSPLRISNIDKLPNKRSSMGVGDAMIVGSVVLGSPKRFSDSEVDGGSGHPGRGRKETSYFVQQQSVEDLRDSGAIDSLRGTFDYQDKESNQLAGGKFEDQKHLKRSLHNDLTPIEAEQMNAVASARNVLDQNSLQEPSDKKHFQVLDKPNNHHHANGSSQRKSGKTSSSHVKDRQRSCRPEADKGNLKVSVSLSEDKDLHSKKYGSSYQHLADIDSREHSEHFEDLRDENHHSKENKGDKDYLGKEETTTKWSTIGRSNNRSSVGMQEDLDVLGSSILPTQHKEKAHIKEDLELTTAYQGEKSSYNHFSDRSERQELASGIGKSQTSGDKQEIQKRGPLTLSSPFKESRQEAHVADAVNADASKVVKQSRKLDFQNGLPHNSLRQTIPNGPETSSPFRKDGHSTAQVLKEARDLKHMANRLKNEGLELESTGLYFEAALKFLHSASLMEPPNFDIAKQGDAAQSMQMYSETAKLCEFCAHEYEKCKEMAAAALAYKCVEVAYMKAAYFKYPGASRDRHELQTALQILPPGESPSSSASDVDNLNNQNTLGKAPLAKGVGSPQIAGNHVISARNHAHFLRLLGYINDLNCAFEATRKSQIAIAAAIVGLEKDGVDGMSSVRKVLDFNFHNVEGLLRLVRLSMESIGL